ncbi:hypothetical protein ETAE_0664 [Edwardsiella piscicida]|uniref:Uncharacterized protein n=1 Tax=Edwardsiella piscicida TaxID=1263550 RepID=A0AAU8PBE4_EDWPI|nr:hypothetical protein ETAE_0664 [Edwardsiella tarda EIB202]
MPCPNPSPDRLSDTRIAFSAYQHLATVLNGLQKSNISA